MTAPTQFFSVIPEIENICNTRIAVTAQLISGKNRTKINCVVSRS